VLLGGVGYCEGGLLAREMPPEHVICWALLLASPFLAIAAALAALHSRVSAGPLAWLCFAYLSTVSMFLGFFAFYRGMAEAGIARVSQIQLAQPVFTLLWSALILGEHVDPPTVAAALFIVGCVLVTLKTRVRTVGTVPEAP
jgi:drug/metabolite transporter (DMT)-like permease